MIHRNAQGGKNKNHRIGNRMHTALENQIKDFKSYLVQLGYSKSTCDMIPRCIKKFLAYTNKSSASSLTTSDIEAFYDYLHIVPNQKQAGGLSDQYINHHVYSVKVFFCWLERTDQIRYNPISVMKFKKPKGNPRQPLTQEEIQVLFDVADTLKERALLHLFYSCGLRSSEGEALNISDVHFKRQILYVRSGKGAKRRAVPMSFKVAQELEQYYLKQRTTEQHVRDSEAFIRNKVGGRMRGLTFNRLLKELLERGSIRKEVSLHYLRHSIATHLLESGLPIESVRDFLGHSHLEATQVYAKVNQKQLRTI